MLGELTIRRSPAVLLWKFAAVEAAAFLLYLIATLFGNAKYELYVQLSFSNFLSYQIAKMLFLSLVQFGFTVYAFLSWYYEEYIVHPGTITHAYGIIRRRERTAAIGRSTMFAIATSPFGKLFRFGSLYVKNGTPPFVLADISRPEKVLKLIRGEFLPAQSFSHVPDIRALLAQDEHDRLEFKSSLRFDYQAGNVSREIEKAAMKTIAAFLNSRGGYLVVGVSDARAPLGLKSDYQTLQRKDSDGFENHLTQSFNHMIGPEFRNLIKLWFHDVEGKDVCVIETLPSPRPVYLKIDNNEYFYMRTGNISTSLKLSEIESYSHSRWPVQG